MKKPEKDELDRYLDGDTGLDDLPPGLKSEELRMVELLYRLRDEAVAPPSLRQGVLREISGLPQSRLRSALEWLVRPRQIQVSPAMATACGLAVALMLVFASGGLPTRDVDTRAVAPTEVVTRFVFLAPEASEVTLTGDWIGWSTRGIPLQELRGTGVWTADVPLPPGVHEYSFIVNGTQWHPDPLAGAQVDDGFGRTNSLVMVSSSEA